jgi:hypothetical protein
MFRKRRRAAKGKTKVAPLMLVSGVYVSGSSIQLSFDRAIDIAAISTGAFIVNDNDDVGEKFEGQGSATLIDPQTVEITLVPAGGPTGTGITLTASAANGIVAQGGAPPVAWAGVTDFVLTTP